jgi:uncharacterized membrane protein
MTQVEFPAKPRSFADFPARYPVPILYGHIQKRFATEEVVPMQTLMMIGFADKHRAIEVLPQLKRLKFSWCADFEGAVAVEVEMDGRLRLHHSQLLDPAHGSNVARWKAMLGVIVPMPHVSQSCSGEAIAELRVAYAEGVSWLKETALDKGFIRDAAAMLQPGNSAILAVVNDSQSALAVLSGYSYLVLHTGIDSSLIDSR